MLRSSVLRVVLVATLGLAALMISGCGVSLPTCAPSGPNVEFCQ